MLPVNFLYCVHWCSNIVDTLQTLSALCSSVSIATLRPCYAVPMAYIFYYTSAGVQLIQQFIYSSSMQTYTANRHHTAIPFKKDKI